MTLQKKRKVASIGNYRFTGKVLGKGNFARVEEAVHNVLNVKVAVKVMDLDQIKEEYVIRNLCREAKLMSKLNHPCIAALYQTLQRSENVYYLVTELVPGGDLCSFIKAQRNGRLEERPTRVYARQFVSALAHMHSIGVVHRDLKMENVMLNTIQTQIKIVDFGLSNVWRPDAPLQTHCGSPEYAAPELFVTGKQYGPEVDLWSLGIILYGMVIGQLPFVSTRNDQVTSQERRKKLVSQINKGLGLQHRRALSQFSSEFRNVMQKLLVADASKRVTVKELLVHPWITEKGTKLLQVNPIKKLDTRWQAKIITEIGTLLHEDPKKVLFELKESPLGRIGGMFNILVHKYCLNQLNGDGVTRALPPLKLETEQNKAQTGCPLKVASERVAKKTTMLVHGVRTDTYSSRSPDQNIKTGDPKPTKPSTPPKENLKARPKSVQPDVAKMIDYRTLKSPVLRRKAYSASIAPNTNRVLSISPEKLEKPDPSKELGNDDGRKKGLTEVHNTIKKLPMKTFTKAQNRDMLARIQTATDDRKNRGKSESPYVIKRPVTSGTVLPNKSSKTISPVFMKTGDIDSKTASRGSTNIKSINKTRNVPPPETSPFAYGDNPSTPRSPFKMIKKPVIFDPIARSIAEYIVNNIPDRLTNVPKTKK